MTIETEKHQIENQNEEENDSTIGSDISLVHPVVQIEKADSDEARITLIENAQDNQLRALKALIRGIIEKKICISRNILNQLKSSGKIPYLLTQFKKTSDIYQDQKRLKKVLIKLSSVLPFLLQAVLKK